MIMLALISIAIIAGESSTFNASMMVSVAPGTATAAGVPSVMSMVNKHEDIDPSKPNDHPILKVCVCVCVCA